MNVKYSEVETLEQVAALAPAWATHVTQGTDDPSYFLFEDEKIFQAYRQGKLFGVGMQDLCGVSVDAVLICTLINKQEQCDEC